MKAEYDVVITSADNGIIVRIGCKTLVFGIREVPEALADIKCYITGTPEERRKLHEQYFPEDFRLNKNMVGQECLAEPMCPPPTLNTGGRSY